FAIRRPVEHAVVDAAARRKRTDVVVERQLPRHAAVGVDDENLLRTAVLAGERDLFPIRREVREVFESGVAGETPRLAAGGIHDPEIAAIAESDMSAANGRLPEQSSELL